MVSVDRCLSNKDNAYRRPYPKQKRVGSCTSESSSHPPSSIVLRNRSGLKAFGSGYASGSRRMDLGGYEHRRISLIELRCTAYQVFPRTVEPLGIR